MTRTRLPCQKERIHWTGLHRLLDMDGFYDQDEAAMPEGEGAEETQRAREAGPPKREESWGLEEGNACSMYAPRDFHKGRRGRKGRGRML